jgi:hypothetical protein
VLSMGLLQPFHLTADRFAALRHTYLRVASLSRPKGLPFGSARVAEIKYVSRSSRTKRIAKMLVSVSLRRIRMGENLDLEGGG